MTFFSNLENLESESEVIGFKKGLQLSGRDKEIIKFILEMKFASMDEVYFHFFRINKDGSKSISQLYARERLTLLKKHGFLKAMRITTENKYYFLGTAKAYEYLLNMTNMNEICKPLDELQAQNFIHDLYVLHSRILISARTQVQRWISEKALIDSLEYKSVFSKEFRPDGLYQTQDGRRFAFELENTLKSKIRTIAKVRRYVEILRREQGRRLIDKVHIVCTKPAIFNSMKEQTIAYGEFFKVEMFDNLSSQATGAVL